MFLRLFLPLQKGIAALGWNKEAQVFVVPASFLQLSTLRRMAEHSLVGNKINLKGRCWRKKSGVKSKLDVNVGHLQY